MKRGKQFFWICILLPLLLSGCGVSSDSQKVLVVPDVHGLDFWEKVKDYDGTIVFLGDYHDPYPFLFSENGEFKEDGFSYDMKTNDYKADSYSNFIKIVEYARNHRDRVHLLLGNHDLAYIDDELYVSRFDDERYKAIKKIFADNSDLFRGACKIGNVLFTHAGVSEEWYDEYLRLHPALNKDSLVANINKAINGREEILIRSSKKRGGTNKYSSPIWLDYEELQDSIAHPLNACYQVFGHTMMPHDGQITSSGNWSCVDSRAVFEIDVAKPKETLKPYLKTAVDSTKSAR